VETNANMEETTLPIREHNANNPVNTENMAKAMAIKKNANMNREP
jgi:hypothetical protein